MAFEALNQLGHLQSDVLVVLNDNGMSISPNVGALSERFSPLHEGESVEDPAGFFTALGLDYHGPVDGHDVLGLVRTLRGLVPSEDTLVASVVALLERLHEDDAPVALVGHSFGGDESAAAAQSSESAADAPAITRDPGRRVEAGPGGRAARRPANLYRGL